MKEVKKRRPRDGEGELNERRRERKRENWSRSEPSGMEPRWRPFISWPVRQVQRSAKKELAKKGE